MYTEQVLDHFAHPRNVGQVPDPDGAATIGDPTCGDFMKISIRVDGNVIADAKFQCQGCPAAIASASVATELAIGRDLDQAMEISDDEISDALGGLPPLKRHCSNLGADALHAAITDHVLRYIGKVPGRGQP